MRLLIKVSFPAIIIRAILIVGTKAQKPGNRLFSSTIQIVAKIAPVPINDRI